MRLLLTAGGLALALLFSAWAAGEAVSSPHLQTAAASGDCSAPAEGCSAAPGPEQLGQPPLEWR